jgi:hypothetical protein
VGRAFQQLVKEGGLFLHVPVLRPWQANIHREKMRRLIARRLTVHSNETPDHQTSVDEQDQ